MKYIILILFLLFGCSKEELICGKVTGGDFDYNTGTYYLRVNGKRQWVDEKTYQSYYVDDFICLQNW